MNVRRARSFGTKFTIAILYIVLANFYTRSEIMGYGYLPEPAITFSVGEASGVVKGIAGKR